jgi:hypothetical protein
MRATLKAARSKCGASLVPSSSNARRRRSFAVAMSLLLLGGKLNIIPIGTPILIR